MDGMLSRPISLTTEWTQTGIHYFFFQMATQSAVFQKLLEISHVEMIAVKSLGCVIGFNGDSD